jgi:hypothetical protein
LIRDPKIFKSNEKKGRAKPGEPVEFIIQDMIPGNSIEKKKINKQRIPISKKKIKKTKFLQVLSQTK